MATSRQSSLRIGSISIACVIFCLLFTSATAEAVSRQWIGASGGLWSVDANWSPVGVPEAGDDLVFPVAASATSVNDIVGFPIYRSIRFDASHTIQGASGLVLAETVELHADVTIESAFSTNNTVTITGVGSPAPKLTFTYGVSGLAVTLDNVVVEATHNVQLYGLTVGTGATYIANSAGALGQPGPTTHVNLAGGTLRVDANGTPGVKNLIGNGTLDLSNPAVNGFFNISADENGEYEFTGTITSANTVLAKSGLGTLKLSGPTTLAMMYIANGDLVVAHPQTLATTTINVFDGATLTYDVTATRTGLTNLVGAGLNGIGALRARGGTLTLTNFLNLDNANATIAVALPHQLLIQGGLNGIAAGQTATLIGDGTIVLGHPTNNLQSIIVGSGVGVGPTLRLGVSNALYIPSPTIRAGATLDINGFNSLIFNLAGAGRVDTGGAGGLATLSDSTTFTGTFHGLGSISALPFTAMTLAGTHTLGGTFTTQSDNLVVTGTMPAAVHSSGDNVTLAPGSAIGGFQFTAAPAVLTVGDATNPGSAAINGALAFPSGGTFKPLLSSATPRLVVNGTVNLTNSQLDLSYTGAIPDGVLILIANDGTDPVVGIFHDVLDRVEINGVDYDIDYAGGDGNDVTLTPVTPLITTYYLSEGATGSFFDTDLLIANPHPFEVSVDITFLRENDTSIVRQQTIAPMSRRTLQVDQFPGLESAAFSTIVEPAIEVPIVVERTMRWDATDYGGHTEKATSGPATTWYFAEGSEGFFRTFLLLANPQTTTNVAHVKWLREGAPAVDRDYTLLPSSRTTIAAVDDQELVNQAFGMTVTFDQPGVAERAMYFGGPPVFKGGHESAGVTAPSTTWLLAEGATGAGFETFILVSNPGADAAEVTFRFLPTSGPPASIVRTVPAFSRLTINPEGENLPIPPGAVGTQVTSTRPVVAERAQYWPLGPAEWTEAHNSFGVTEAAPRWGLAEGRVGGARNYQTYILLANPGSNAATVNLDFLPLDGGVQSTPVPQSVTVAPQTRVNVPVSSSTPNVEVHFGTVINSNEPIVVERAMYWDAAGETWAAGTNATATKLPPPQP
jgi:hypothetical protein